MQTTRQGRLDRLHHNGGNGLAPGSSSSSSSPQALQQLGRGMDRLLSAGTVAGHGTPRPD